MKEVTIVHPCQNIYGGAEEVVVRVANGLPTRGWFPRTVLLDPPEEMLSDFNDGLAVSITETYLQFRRLAQRHLYVADACLLYNFPATLAAWPTRLPTVWYCNEPPELFTNWKRQWLESFSRSWIKRTNMKVAVATDYDRKRFNDIYDINPEVIPYGVDYDFWGRPSTRKPQLHPQIRLLHVGTVIPEKGASYALGALIDLVHNHQADAILSIYGSTPDADYLQALIDTALSAGVSDRVHYYGQVSRIAVRQAYQTHDVLLHIVDGVGGWLAPLEATCAALPVIVGSGFQLSERFKLVPKSDEEMSHMILHALDSDNLKERRLWIKEELTWDRYIDRITNLLET